MQENETAPTAEQTETTDAIAGNEITSETAVGQTETVETTANQTENAGGETAAEPTETAETQTETASQEPAPETPVEPEVEEEPEEITYHAVQKDHAVTAIWEMQGRRHLRTIDPRSREGAEILRLFTAEEGEETA